MKRVFSILVVVLMANPVFAKIKLSDVVKGSNKHQSLSAFREQVKYVFDTKADHKEIDKVMLGGGRTPASKSLWRFELKEGKKIAFRVNGRVQFYLSDFADDGRALKVNGKLLKFPKGTPFKKAFKDLNTIMKATDVVKFEQLFMHEADAIAPFFLALLTGAVFTSASVAAEASLTPLQKCQRDPRPNPASPYHNLAAQNSGPAFVNGAPCSSKWMPKDLTKRLRMVSSNFRPNGRFHWEKADNRCIHFAGNEPEYLICQCKQRKMIQNCDRGGWRMTEAGANAICRYTYGIMNQCKYGPRPAAVVPAAGNSADGCYVGKDGVPYGNCPGQGGGTGVPVSQPNSADQCFVGKDGVRYGNCGGQGTGNPTGQGGGTFGSPVRD